MAFLIVLLSGVEGASGYFAVFAGLCGGLAGLAAGIVLAIRLRGARWSLVATLTRMKIMRSVSACLPGNEQSCLQ